jgi:nucleotide-binding universal stress UspA family protein
MPENKTVIVATDGSDHSLRVLPHADCLASNLGAGIELLRVVERDDISEEPGDSESAAIERARARLEDEMQGDLKRFGVKGEVRVVIAPEGEDPARTLLSLGSRGLLLAMHSRGRGGIARILHGSVALGVLKEVAQPVMLGGPELLPPPADGDTYRLVVTTDLSPDADYALRSIAPLLEQGKFQVTLLYVHLHAPGGVDNEAERARCEDQLAQKRALLSASVPVDTVMREIPIGAGVDTAIMEVAQELGAHAIAMATHGASARHHLLMGSVAMSILGRSRLPLIVARAQG